MGLVLDTSALVALERAGGSSLPQALASLAGEEVAIPAIVVAVLLAGVRRAAEARRAAHRRAKIDAVLALAPVIDFSKEIAEVWADLFAALERQGNRIPANDLAVAATAVFLGFSSLAMLARLQAAVMTPIQPVLVASPHPSGRDRSKPDLRG